jgi:hypothetical protein
MKSLKTAAALAAATLVAPALAHAQASTSLAGVYGNLGYADAHGGGVDLGAIQGRLGYRYNNYLGVEGEGAIGVNSDHTTVAPGVTVRDKLRHQEAVYGVGYWPLNNKFDVLGRVGYGGSTVRTSALGVHDTDSDNSWNYGVGAQYHLDGQNGVRADFTRQEFIGHSQADHANVWSVAYSRRF